MAAPPPGLSPDAVDALTELSSLLVHLRAAEPASSSGAGGSLLGSLGSIPGATPAPAPGAVTGTTPLPSGAANIGATNSSLSVKELPIATDNLKHKLQRARAAVKTLPDVSRTLVQQEEEIAELEGKKRQQLEMLQRIKGARLQFDIGEETKTEEGERMVE
ncbi:hypothetical protein OQA88_9849 [Cercophora sp. LCS_1]